MDAVLTPYCTYHMLQKLFDSNMLISYLIIRYNVYIHYNNIKYDTSSYDTM